MSDSKNPYESPQVKMDEAKKPTATGEITQAMTGFLYGTSPWMRFLGITGYIGAAFVVLLGISMAIGMSAISGYTEELQGFSGLVGAGLGFLYVIFGVFMFFPAHFAYKAGTGIKSYKQSGLNSDLENAFQSNKSLWKFIGILTIIQLSLIPVVFVIAVVIGVLAAI